MIGLGATSAVYAACEEFEAENKDGPNEADEDAGIPKTPSKIKSEDIESLMNDVSLNESANTSTKQATTANGAMISSTSKEGANIAIHVARDESAKATAKRASIAPTVPNKIRATRTSRRIARMAAEKKLETPLRQMQQTPIARPSAAEPRREPKACFVVKFSLNDKILKTELDLERRLEEKYRVGWNPATVFRIKDTEDGRMVFSDDPNLQDYPMIIGVLHEPLVPSAFSLPLLTPLELKKQYWRDLLDNLVAIHKTGMVHRDLRLQNILFKKASKDAPVPEHPTESCPILLTKSSEDESVILEKSSEASKNASKSIPGRFIIADFGFAAKAGDEDANYSGSIETASNRVLYLLSEEKNVFSYFKEDDLESLLKLFKMSIAGPSFAIPKRKRPEPNTLFDYISYYKELFLFWANDNDILRLSSLKSYEEKLEYLKTYVTYFSSYDDAVKAMLPDGVKL
jgi:hypothetical protein